MAKYNIYGHVLYSEIQYEKLMYITEKIFIQSLMNRIDSITDWVEDIWDTIDHEYMLETLEEIRQEVIRGDIELMLKYREMPVDISKMKLRLDELEDLFTLNTVDKFQTVERKYGRHISDIYKSRIKTLNKGNVDEFEYLTKQIANFSKLEQTVPYFNNEGDIVRMVTPSTYLSMLYNVNLTRTGWNQTFKDAEYFENDLVLLETHPHSCPLCAPMQR